MKAPKVWPLKKKHVAILAALVLAGGIGGVALWQAGTTNPSATTQGHAAKTEKAKKGKEAAKQDASAKKEDKKEDKKTEEKGDAKPEDAKPQAASSGAAPGGTQAGAPEKSSSTSSNSQNASSAPAPSSAPSGNTSAPAHKKEPRWIDEQGHWEPVYETRTTYDTVNDYEDYEVIVFPDGYETVDANAGRKYHHDTGLAYRVVTRTRVVGAHQEPSGTEQVQTGNRWVVDVPGHWE